jgi:hypothetical protein
LKALRKDDYDRAFCVFDRDSHPGFAHALAQVEQSAEGQQGRLKAIVSWPCFEVWILLHFVMTTHSFTAGAGRSACEQVIQQIAGHLPHYVKGAKDVFVALAGRLDAATTHAERLAVHNQETGSENPATNVHTLITYLKGLKQP